MSIPIAKTVKKDTVMDSDYRLSIKVMVDQIESETLLRKLYSIVHYFWRNS